MNGTLRTHSHIGDRLPAVLNLFGQGNVVVWAPTGIAALLEHFKGKAPFKRATDKSKITIPAQCKIAILGDWGADNDHAQTIGNLVQQQNPDYLVHLGDIYYSGSEPECRKFLENWPLRDASGQPKQGASFSLNGNHEMYSEGRYYFTTVLDGLGQEASYFQLSNDWWQFLGFDTAYVPFTISGGVKDDNLQCQWDFLVDCINASPAKKNILLSHNQPVSAFLKETADGAPLREEYARLIAATRSDAVYGWFFGHEHRCTIYDDAVTDYKARLLGNGAIPHDPQTETTPQTDGNNDRHSLRRRQSWTPRWRPTRHLHLRATNPRSRTDHGRLHQRRRFKLLPAGRMDQRVRGRQQHSLLPGFQMSLSR